MSAATAGALAKNKLKVWHPPNPAKPPSDTTLVAYLYRAQAGLCFHCLGPIVKHHYSETWGIIPLTKQ